MSVLYHGFVSSDGMLVERVTESANPQIKFRLPMYVPNRSFVSSNCTRFVSA